MSELKAHDHKVLDCLACQDRQRDKDTLRSELTRLRSEVGEMVEVLDRTRAALINSRDAYHRRNCGAIEQGVPTCRAECKLMTDVICLPQPVSPAAVAQEVAASKGREEAMREVVANLEAKAASKQEKQWAANKECVREMDALRGSYESKSIALIVSRKREKDLREELTRSKNSEIRFEADVAALRSELAALKAPVEDDGLREALAAFKSIFHLQKWDKVWHERVLLIEDAYRRIRASKKSRAAGGGR